MDGYSIARARVRTALEMTRRLVACDAGIAAVYTAVGMMVFVGAAGLAVDVASWYRAKRTAQTAADAAAYAGALDLARQGLNTTADTTAMQAAANDAATRNGMTLPVALHHPPTSGIEWNDSQSVEVLVTEPAPMIFSSAFLGSVPQVRARAVAKAVIADACVYALSPDERGALTLVGTADVQLGCGVVVNSVDDAALEQEGSSCLEATAITVAGGVDGSCLFPDPEIYTPQYGDPLASLSEPAFSGCDHSNLHLSGNNGATTSLLPGVYCGGIKISGGAVVFAPGRYVLDGGELRISGNATASNTENASGGVTFYLTGSGSDYATVWIASGADVRLTPTRTGTYADVLFFQDRAAPAGNTSKFTGGSTCELEGALYFPNGEIEFTGGSAVAPAEVLVVADTLKFSGNSHLEADYTGSLLNGNGYARLVE